MKNFQERIKQFDEARNWQDDWNIKDLCLNLNEEIGELWHLIKWVDEEKQKEIINAHKTEAGNFIADALWILFKMANQMEVDANEELEKLFEEYEKRMPAEKMKTVRHANKFAGGVDDKD